MNVSAFGFSDGMNLMNVSAFGPSKGMNLMNGSGSCDPHPLLSLCSSDVLVDFWAEDGGRRGELLRRRSGPRRVVGGVRGGV